MDHVAFCPRCGQICDPWDGAAWTADFEFLWCIDCDDEVSEKGHDFYRAEVARVLELKKIR